ncbi:MAG: UDP-N-acetylmuramoyl-tripeptide--D-alanyl-D-alanine ligase [Clostridium sp.]|nr:UDP-N-acetylmuramoyl-tripeptide--D-alanyl-D-alanine ligase [Clostridium sp.]MCM1444423.1 UDP-N-acetylmuramoyl-tripeptide--D-alanyl-D-alanine ligase [Candidatus Amulumruptor caecigallinarius]
MNLYDIFKISNGKILNGKLSEKKINSIKFDSKEVNKNDLFICIKGVNKNGHDYVKDVEDSAICIIVSEDIKIKSNVLVIKVDNTIEFMNNLVLYIRKKYINIPLIAITGSVGKTTTKELLKHILKEKYNILVTKKNENNNFGVAKTFFDMKDNYNLIILEMGMNHLNEIKNLSSITLPNLCIITNIGSSHIGYLKNKKNILKAKMEITEGLNNGILLLNNNDLMLKKVHKNKNNNIYGINDFDISNVICTDNHLFFDIIYQNKKYNIKFNIPSIALIDNILLTIKTSLIYGLDINYIIERISSFKTLDGRNNIIKLKNNIVLVDDSYNSSYESIIAALNMIKNIKDKKIIILGDVLELGSKSKKIHKKIGKILKKYCRENNALVLTVGKYMYTASKVVKSKHFYNNDLLIKYINNLHLENSCILLKASRRMHFEKIKDIIIEKNS